MTHILFFTYLILLFFASAAKFKDQSGEFLDKQIKKQIDKKVKCNLKKVTFGTLENMRLMAIKDPDSIILCYLQALQDSSLQSSHGHLWSALGTIYEQKRATTQAATCFKQAQRISGKITSFIKDWHFIGPFVIGKMELDGDPLESYGGIRNVSRYRYQKSAGFYSELVPGGEIKWKTEKQASVNDMVQIRSGVDWNDLANGVGSLGITEWQGWLVGDLAINDKDQNIAVQCHGVSTIYIDDIPVTGDVYHRGKYWYGVNLDQGLHTVYIRLRTKVAGKFRCSFKIAKPDFEVMLPHFMPDLMSGYLFSGFFSLPVSNYHSVDFLKITKVTLQDIRPSNLDLNIEMVYKNEQVAPGQIYMLPLKLISPEPKLVPQCKDTDAAGDVSFNLKLTTSAGSQSLPIALRCRKFRQSFLFTFLDHDGSVQQAAAIPPLQDCPGGLCPTLLTLHGTTITPQNQADSYKQMVNGEFQFGSLYAWLLAPTRHGAHNWEGPGLLTALTALEKLGEITGAADWIINKADANHVIFAGHSMGGHGAWHIATHYPDRCLGLISLASWIKKEEYGDSNLFFRHDISTSHADPAVKMIMEACIAENDADRHVPNLRGIPVIARIGANDRTVHPYFVRRMYRLLKEEGVAVNYSEVAGKEHWWWDTGKTNDGGAVNDQKLRDFTNKYVLEHVFSSGTCSDGDCTEEDGSHGYLSGLERNFTVVCYNPALGEGVAGVKILQQSTPFRQSKIQVIIKDGSVVLTTVNVRRFSISEPNNRKVNWKTKFLKIDRSEVFSSDTLIKLITDEHAHLCKIRGDWKVCSEDIYQLGMRGPLNLGPARRIAEFPFLIVIGTSGDSSMQQYILQVAVYIANLFFLTSDTSEPIVKDSELQEDDLGKKNLIIIGNTAENLLTRQFIGNIPVEVKDNMIQIDACNFRNSRMGFLSLVPNGNHRLALLLMGTSKQGLSDIVTLATPTIPPMTRSPFSNLVPDYVITGPEFGRKGPGGYLCAGFWGNSWEYRSDISSCVCDL